MNPTLKKLLFALSAVAIMTVSAFLYFDSQAFQDVYARGRQFYDDGNYSRSMPHLEQALSLRPKELPAVKMLDDVYAKLGFETKQKKLREKYRGIFVSQAAAESVPTASSLPAPKPATPQSPADVKPAGAAKPAAAPRPAITESSVDSKSSHPAQQDTVAAHESQRIEPVSVESKDSIAVLRERARAMTWEGNWDAADRTYAEAEHLAGPESAPALERKAKSALAAGHLLAAENAYLKWLEFEPESIEALSGLGDVYARTGRKREALELYLEIQTMLGGQPWILSKVRKLERETGAWILESGGRYREADSASRSSDVRTAAGFSKISREVAQGLEVRGELENQHLYFSNHPPVERRKSSAGGTWIWPRLLETLLDYSHSAYSKGLPDTHNGSVKTAAIGFDGFVPSVFYSREDVIENASTLRSGLHLNRAGFRLEERPLRRVLLTQRFERADYSDGNVRRDFASEVVFRALEGPRQLDLFYNYLTYGYDEAAGLYFSPDDFHVNEGGFEWRQYRNPIGPGEDPEDYYAFRYTANFDVHGQVGHRFGWRGRWQIRRDWTLQAEMWKQVYEHETIYGEMGANLWVSYAFGNS